MTTFGDDIYCKTINGKSLDEGHQDLASVLTNGNTANKDIDLNGNSIRNGDFIDANRLDIYGGGQVRLGMNYDSTNAYMLIVASLPKGTTQPAGLDIGTFWHDTTDNTIRIVPEPD